LAGAGADAAPSRTHSEQTAREIDEEVRRIIDTAMERVRRIMESRRGALEAITQRLIEREVIDGDELRTVIEAATGAPQLVPGTESERRPPRPLPADAAEAAPGVGDASG